MNILGVIPARYGSTRLPAKPLIKINGRPLLEWVVRGVQSSTRLSELVVATDHPEIMGLAESIGVKAEMTSPDLPSGSDRVWAVAKSKNCDLVLNIQGDEPLIEGWWVDNLVELFLKNNSVNMGTLAHALKPDELHEKGAVKVILDSNNDAIYFSRFGIPYSRLSLIDVPGLAYKHMGIYGYKKNFLQQFCEQKPTDFERAESLEQLRALWMGTKIKVAVVPAFSVGVDTPEDVKTVENLLAHSNRRT